jgi:hypothetical protein
MAIYLFPFGMCALLALLYQLKLVRAGRGTYALALLSIGLFAGLRFETGQDWPAYEEFFNNLDTFDPFDSRFEIGYYLLNYGVKYLGGSYSVVLLIASLFCAYAVYRLTSRMRINRFYVLTAYMGYSFLILHFAQVRQSLAVGFFLLGFDHYLKHHRKLPALLITLIGSLFQISALIYIVILGAVFVWQGRNSWLRATALVGAAVLYVASQLVDIDFTVSLGSLVSAQEKIAIYRELQVDQGIFQVLYSGYLFVFILYLLRYSDRVAPEHVIIVRYAVASLFVTILFTYMFSGSYVFYSRAYAIACLFQGFAAAVVFASRKGWLHNLTFAISLLAACISYWRMLTFYADQYTPYHVIFGVS